MKRHSPDVSDLKLEQFVLGELTPREDAAIREALGTDQALKARLEAIGASNREILASYPPEEVAPQIRRRMLAAEPSGWRPRARTYVSIALPAAAALLVLLSMFALRTSPADTTRLKGDSRPHLTIFKKTLDGAEELKAGFAVRQADVLQIGYAAADARYGSIFSIDGRGVVTFHLPEGYTGATTEAPLLERQAPTMLSFAYELDDAPRFERFFFVYSRTPFELDQVAQAARALASRQKSADRDPLRLPQGVGVASLLLKK